jgi:hypothetical protein
MVSRKFSNPSSPLARLYLWMQQHGHGALLAGEVCNRTQPLVEGQANPGKSDRYPKGERQDHADRCALTQYHEAFGDGVPNHGGHIPS